MNGNIVQQNHFYPFGQTMAISSGQGAQPYKFTGKELDLENGLNLYDFEARTYDPSIGRFTTVDPLAEKYYSISPYAYCANNPINCIDPTGMDVYRYDDKTGEMILHKKTDDNFDQIGKFKTVKNKETGEKTYELKTKKDGTAKTRIDNIEKGILSDGINFKENNNVINVGGEGQATVAGFESFITQFSDMIDKEIGGFYYTPTGKNSISDISHIYVGKFQNNTDQKAFATPKFHLVRPDLVGTLDIHTDFHTHLSRFPESAKLVPSGLSLPGGDMQYKKNQSVHGIKRFIILTTGYPPIPY
jgi:RHS repeat-associated protein